MFGDISFSLSLAGIQDADIYKMLTRGAIFELNRTGKRKSCTQADLHQLAERFACSGVTDQVCNKYSFLINQ